MEFSWIRVVALLNMVVVFGLSRLVLLNTVRLFI